MGINANYLSMYWGCWVMYWGWLIMGDGAARAAWMTLCGLRLDGVLQFLDTGWHAAAI